MINTLPKSLIETARIILEGKCLLEDIHDPIPSFREKWKNAGIDNFVTRHSSSGDITLHSLIIPKGKQRQGIGSQYMNDLKLLADKHNSRVVTSPSSDFGASKTGLMKFFKGHGFVENKGKNKDYSLSGTMYRTPEVYKGGEEVTPEKIDTPKQKQVAPVKDTIIPLYKKNKSFTSWFGDSKVTNAVGYPIEVYHGTPDIRGIKETGKFHNKSSGIFFTNDTKTAASYADPKRAVDYQNAEPGIISAHLKISNPYIHDHEGKDWFGTDKVIEDARLKGHDGVIIKNVVDRYNTDRVKSVKPSNVYVVFNSKQIKHSTKNSGEHSQEKDSIYE